MQGCTAYTTGSRCATHALPGKGKTADRGYGAAWRRWSEGVRARWVEEHGWWCPGWETDGHSATDLTVDHDVGVLCRRCNGRKGGGHDRRTTGPKGGNRPVPRA